MFDISKEYMSVIIVFNTVTNILLAYSLINVTKDIETIFVIIGKLAAEIYRLKNGENEGEHGKGSEKA